MKATKTRDDPTTLKGAKDFLNYWLYGMLKTSSDLGAEGVFLRNAEEAAVQKFLEVGHLDLGDVRVPEEILEAYHRAMEERGMLDRTAITMRRDGERLRFEIGQACPYRTVCGWAHAEGRLRRCFRTLAFAEVLLRQTGRVWDGTLEEFGIPCRVSVSPSRLEVH